MKLFAIIAVSVVVGMAIEYLRNATVTVSDVPQETIEAFPVMKDTPRKPAPILTRVGDWGSGHYCRSCGHIWKFLFICPKCGLEDMENQATIREGFDENGNVVFQTLKQSKRL